MSIGGRPAWHTVGPHEWLLYLLVLTVHHVNRGMVSGAPQGDTGCMTPQSEPLSSLPFCFRETHERQEKTHLNLLQKNLLFFEPFIVRSRTSLWFGVLGGGLPHPSLSELPQKARRCFQIHRFSSQKPLFSPFPWPQIVSLGKYSRC